MAYLVKLTGRAERDLEELYEAIAAQSSSAALKWYQGLKRAILSLEDSPLRCPPTPEDKRLRHLLYGRKPHVYRVIYQVVQRGRTVHVLHIRHGARDEFAREEIAR
jgi:plasmid stabilization system protein ParE